MRAIFYGVSPAVIALILHSCYRLAKLGMEDAIQWVIAGVCLAVTVALQTEVALLSLVALARWQIKNPVLVAATALVGLIAFPLLKPTWIFVK